MKAIAADVPISFRLVFETTVVSILNVAHEENADLIVIGSHRRTSFIFNCMEASRRNAQTGSLPRRDIAAAGPGVLTL